MPLPLIVPLAAGGAALWLMLSSGKSSAKPAKSTVKKTADGKVTTTVPTADGKGYKLTTTPENLAAIMAMSKTNDAGKMTAMAAQYMMLGKTNEAIACNHLAAVIATHQATGGKKTKQETASKVAAAANKTAPTTASPPASMVNNLKDLNAAGATPEQLHAIADQFSAAGYPAQAASIDAAADELENSIHAPSTVTSPGIASAPQFTPLPAATPAALPTISLPTIALPAAPKTAKPKAQKVSLPKPKPQPKPTARRLAADALVQELGVNRPPYGKENQAIVSAYEKALGATASGKYGLGLARTLAEPESGNHVPPPVRYWPASASSIAKYGNYIKAANDYDAWLMAQKAADPARAAEWQDAYQHARDFWPSGSKPQPRR